jgi:aryl-alcohol dehydrogenase-like predicted oxidoreductase
LRVEDKNDIAKRELGRTGLQVTTLGYGAMELRGAPRARDISEAQAETILNKVLDAGINYIDTSVDYGVSEERIGRYISHRRAEYYLVVHTKQMTPDPHSIVHAGDPILGA